MTSKKIISAMALTLLLAAGSAAAQTTTPDQSTPVDQTTAAPVDQTTSAPSTPGTPNTGAGGDATTNLAILGVSALVLVGGAAYLGRKIVVNK